jgi:hypothetical protein
VDDSVGLSSSHVWSSSHLGPGSDERTTNKKATKRTDQPIFFETSVGVHLIITSWISCTSNSRWTRFLSAAKMFPLLPTSTIEDLFSISSSRAS